MSFISKCFQGIRILSGPVSAWVSLGFLFILPQLFAAPLAHADVFVASVSGTVSVKLAGYPRVMPLRTGAWLPADIKLQFQGDSRASVLCLGTGEMLTLDSGGSGLERCNRQPERRMRASGGADIPVVLIPNQRELDRVTRVVWAGPKDARYTLVLVKYDSFGTETRIESPEWADLDSKYSDTGIHEYELPEYQSLAWDDAESYEIVVIDLESGRSSNEDNDYTSQVVSRIPGGLIEDVKQRVGRIVGGDDLDLATLATASELISRGFRTQAYDLLATMTASRWEVAKRLARVRALRIPASPAEVMVGEYADVLSLAAREKDVLNATIVCQQLQVYLDMVPSGGRSLLDLSSSKGFSEYCERS